MRNSKILPILCRPVFGSFLPLVCCLSLRTLAQPGPVSPGGVTHGSPPAQTGTFAIVERGPHHRVWKQTVWSTNHLGRVTCRTNTYSELQTGMAHLVGGQWVNSTEEIGITASGASATNAPHHAAFAANANTAGALQLRTPDQKSLSSHVICLSYFDTASGSNVMIAEIHDSIGLLLEPNRILYTNALRGDCESDILYVFNKAGLEQNAILRTRPPPPDAFGLSTHGIMLQLWSEFLAPPTPNLVTNYVAYDSETTVRDVQLDFGATQIGPGRAFLLGDADETEPSTRVVKEWVTISHRTFLVESVPLDAIAPQLSQLPPASPGGTNGVRGAMLRPGSRRPPQPATREARAATKSIQVASLDIGARPGFLLDYAIVASQTNAVFNSDTTYYVSGSVNLSGSNVFFGGSVIKFTNGASINLVPIFTTPTVKFITSAYRPVIFTAKDDDSVGDVITGSSHAPSGYYANPALTFVSLNATVPNIRISYCKTALTLSGASADISNAQFVNCQNAFNLGGSSVTLRNAILANTPTNFICSGAVTGSGENVTFSGSVCLASAPASPSGCAFALTNCILANLTNLALGSLSLTGAYNGFYATAPFGVSTSSISAYPFQTAAAGSYYLADRSPARNAGTAALNAALLADLRAKTTYPPIVLSNATVSSDASLWPQAQRDTDLPDLGYHYSPLDWVCKNLRITGATLQVNPGTAIATVGGSGGIALLSGSQFHCQGLPTNPNWIVRYNLVQESADTNWNGMSSSIGGDFYTGPVTPQARFRFTHFSMPAQDAAHFDNTYRASVSASDCSFYGGTLIIRNPGLCLTNCLWDHVGASIDDFWYGNDLSPIVRNCLFAGGQLSLNHENGDSWLFSDNAFDHTTIIKDPDGGDVQGAQNGYTIGSARLSPTNINDVVTNVTWQSGRLGNYYQPTNSGFVNRGSATADSVGLYHYTVSTNLVSGFEIKEGSSTVDLGVHWVALDVYGVPINTDGDGMGGDYWEDINGNGTANTGETDWQVSENGTTGAPGLQVFTVLE